MKLTEAESRTEMLQTRLKELQAEIEGARKKLEISQQNNKQIKQQVG